MLPSHRVSITTHDDDITNINIESLLTQVSEPKSFDQLALLEVRRRNVEIKLKERDRDGWWPSAGGGKGSGSFDTTLSWGGLTTLDERCRLFASRLAQRNSGCRKIPLRRSL